MLFLSQLECHENQVSLTFYHSFSYNPLNFQGMTRDDLFNTNATIVLKLSEAAAQ